MVYKEGLCLKDVPFFRLQACMYQIGGNSRVEVHCKVYERVGKSFLRV